MVDQSNDPDNGSDNISKKNLFSVHNNSVYTVSSLHGLHLPMMSTYVGMLLVINKI